VVLVVSVLLVGSALLEPAFLEELRGRFGVAMEMIAPVYREVSGPLPPGVENHHLININL
jgi:hypothetical protein